MHDTDLKKENLDATVCETQSTENEKHQPQHSNPNSKPIHKPKPKKSSPKTTGQSKEVAKANAKLDKLLADKAKNEQAIEGFKNKILEIEADIKAIDDDITLAQKEISSMMFAASDTTGFMEMAAAYSNLDVDPAEILRLAHSGDFEKLASLMQKSSG